MKNVTATILPENDRLLGTNVSNLIKKY